MRGWPTSAAELIEEQSALGEEAPTAWEPGQAFVAGGCFVCFERGPSGPGEQATGLGPRLRQPT